MTFLSITLDRSADFRRLSKIYKVFRDADFERVQDNVSCFRKGIELFRGLYSPEFDRPLNPPHRSNVRGVAIRLRDRL